MGLLRDIFGPSKNEIWSQLAAEINGEFSKDGQFKSGFVRASHKQWEMILDTHLVKTGKQNTTYTRMRAPFINTDGLYLKIYRKNLFTGIRSFFGMHDIVIGDPYFDEQFIIKGNNADKIRQLLSSKELTQLIDAQPRISLEIQDDGGFFGAAFPEGVDQLVFLAPGVMQDIKNLRSLFELFATFLERFVQIDPAYENDPNVGL